MLKKTLCLFSLSMFISLPAFAKDYPPFDATVKYYAPCPNKDYEKCAKENKKIIIKAMPGNSKILDLKQAIFKSEKNNKKFSPDEQMITCNDYWPNDTQFADVCWNDKLKGVSVDLNLK
ncbi:hypothetical protein [Candidatus Rickettsiella viridis]|nr:hypothetical protein [Candidatus Rickettsiella viridis]